MNFSSMEYFVTLARERNFTRAAEHLHITQQSLSAHIACLEKELGCRLLVRHVPLELTYAGEVLLRYASSFQKELTAMQREFSDISRNQKGLLRVGVAATRGRTILPGIIRSFQRSYPNIGVELTEGSNDGLHQRLLDGAVDLAIANFPDALQGVVLRDFYREEIVLLLERAAFTGFYGTEAVACEARLRAGDFSALRDFPFVLGSMDDIDGRIGRAALKRAGVERPIVKAASHNVGTLLSLCLLGVGACFCPENLARATLSAEQFSSLLLLRLGDGARYQIRFGHLAQSYQWSVIEAFMRIAQEEMASAPA